MAVEYMAIVTSVPYGFAMCRRINQTTDAVDASSPTQSKNLKNLFLSFST